MRIHSKFLIHWTGEKDIEKYPENIRSKEYVKRLKNYYQEGLLMNRATEDVIRKKKIKNLVRICFTEIRLSQAQTHADRYGKLGIGFTRDFIMNKGGRPLIYIPYKADKCLLEDSIKKAYELSNKKTEEMQEIHRSLKWILSHVKRMSNMKNENHENYEDYYEEMEWRLVNDEGNRRVEFNANDIKIIIFPDEETKRISFEDNIIKNFFSQHMPNIVILKDCDNF